MFLEYKKLIAFLNVSLKDKELAKLSGLCESIETCYDKILKYKLETLEEGIEFNMESFDFKTASSLIPLMNGKEETTEQIIEGIEMYNETLKSEDSKKLLISYVLKMRLSKTARLKLKSDYLTVENLLFDIKKYLLTKKSANSLLSQLNGISQSNTSISEYGEKLEDLFISLTISQADNNQKAAEILRPINEQLAIKRFADGLRNRRLSTIISARNYASLKDAVQAAQDEELAGPSNQDSVNWYTRGKSNQNSPRYNNNYRRGRFFYHRGRGQHPFYQRGHYHQNPNRGNYNFNQGRYQRGYTRSNRGSYKNFRHYNRGNMNAAVRTSYDEPTTERKQEEKVNNLSEFFRV